MNNNKGAMHRIPSYHTCYSVRFIKWQTKKIIKTQYTVTKK